MSLEQISRIFPYKEIRDQQQTAIEFIIDKFSAGKNIVILEAGTGVGKSAIAYAVSEYMRAFEMTGGDTPRGGNFLTTQKILQQQYTRDFESLGMNSIYSSTNYTCKFHKQNTCAESSRLLRTSSKGEKFWNTCVMNCPYRKSKTKFIEGNHGVTNFSYFLAETTYSGKIPKRRLLVIDEAHNAPGELSKFIEISVSSRFCEQVLKLKIPDVKEINTQKKAFDWITDVYYPKLVSMNKHIETMLEKYVGLKDKMQQFAKLAQRFEILDKYSCKVKRFIDVYSQENWVYNPVQSDDQSISKIEFKPIDVSHFANENLFAYGEKVLLMSATILDKEGFCEMMGIKRDEVSFLRLPSPFPPENKPIFFHPVGKMSSSHIGNTLPLMAKAVKQILDNHKNEKGIIHCHSFRIANYLKNNIRSNRLLIHNSSNRDEILKKHEKGRKPYVLLSPSMAEGVDLKDELSRFQVICKIPYPYLGDKLVKKKMNKWKWWYSLETAKKIVQSAGRSIRNHDDHAITYILDSDWSIFYNRNKGIFPPEFHECLVE